MIITTFVSGSRVVISRVDGDPAAGHPDVEQAEVGPLAQRRLDGARAVGRLRDDDEAVVLLDRLAQVGARRRVVVGDQHADLRPLTAAPPRPPCRRRGATSTWSVPPIALRPLGHAREAEAAASAPAHRRGRRSRDRRRRCAASGRRRSRARRGRGSRRRGAQRSSPLRALCERAPLARPAPRGRPGSSESATVAPTRSATPFTASESTTSSGSSSGRVSVAITRRDSSSARSAAFAICSASAASEPLLRPRGAHGGR